MQPRVQAPEVTQGLLDWLNQAFPLSDFERFEVSQDFLKHQGARAVVNHLQALHAMQQKQAGGPYVPPTSN